MSARPPSAKPVKHASPAAKAAAPKKTPSDSTNWALKKKPQAKKKAASSKGLAASRAGAKRPAPGKPRKAAGKDIIPYHRKPEALSAEDWQKALRKQFVPERPLGITRLDRGHPFFGDYSVHNPASGKSYKVALRDGGAGLNYCECLDFRTSHLGTCKHIEAVLGHVSRRRGAKKAIQEGYQPPYSSVYLHYGERRSVRLRIGTDKAQEFATLAPRWFGGDLVLKPGAVASFEIFLSRATALDEGFRCYDDALAFVLAGRENQRRKALIEKQWSSALALDGILKTRLYPYQRSGILFAAIAGRSLIADEMGLGKTIQAIGVAEVLRQSVGIQRVLIVCPTSLKYQWRSEIMRFSDLSVRVIEGQPHARSLQYAEGAFFTVTSYHAVSRDLDLIARMEPDMVILDEAQRIKNWKTLLARSVKRIESPYALVLTGTPLENNLEELYSIVSFIDPWKLGPFWRFLAEHQIRDPAGKVSGYQGLGQIGSLLSDMTLRRRKAEVLKDLPERIDKRIFVTMTEKQRGMHDEFGDTVRRIVRKWRMMGFLNEQDRQRLMIAMNQMRMVCDSTYILDQDQEHRHDTKIAELMGILDECLGDPEQKVVVFSQWERMTRLVAMELEGRGTGFRSLHGSVPSAARKELYDSFNMLPDCRVFLSTDAGSTGLNLQSASILVNLDLPWNPAVLEQRIGRIHRLGQKKNVTIINLIALDSIESRMLNLIGFKSELARGILDAGADTIFMNDDNHKRFMSTVEEIVAMPVDGVDAEVARGGGEEGEAAELEGRDGTASDDVGASGRHAASGKISAEDNDSLAISSKAEGHETAPPDAGELVARGLAFFSDLSRSLSAPGGAKALVASLSEKDPATGKTCIRIPIENEAAAAAALSTLVGLFSALGRGTGP